MPSAVLAKFTAKMITKNFARVIALFLLLAFLAPASVLAAQTPKPKASRSGPGQIKTERPTSTSSGEETKRGETKRPEKTSAAAVCERLDAFIGKLGQNLNQARTKLSDAKQERSEKLKDRSGKNDERLSEVREKADGNREEHYAKLKQRAETEAQKQAVEDFIAAVDDAVKARKAAVDDAIEAYRQGLADAAKTRQAAVEAAKKNFEAAVEAAKAKAKADCGSTDGAAVRTALLEALKQAKEQLAKDIRAAKQVETTLRELKAARREAVQKAFEDFRAAFKKALDRLKEAFKTASDDSSDSSSADDSE